MPSNWIQITINWLWKCNFFFFHFLKERKFKTLPPPLTLAACFLVHFYISFPSPLLSVAANSEQNWIPDSLACSCKRVSFPSSAMEESTSSVCNLGVLDALSDDAIQEIIENYNGFCAATQTLLRDAGDLNVGPEFVAHVHGLCKHGLASLVQDHFLKVLEVNKFGFA